jgi:hypothetical protein
MLSQLEKLYRNTEGRYATNEELEFVSDYLRLYGLRLQTYRKLQELEGTIIQQVYARMKSENPSVFLSGKEDVSVRCKHDLVRVFRYSAISMLLNDPDTLRERFLFWLQTMMKGYGVQHQRSSKVAHELMQEVDKQHLAPQQADLFVPILQLNCQVLGLR